MSNFTSKSFGVFISAASSTWLSNIAPNDGFIDPVSVEKYEALQTITGSLPGFSAPDSSTLILNNKAITFTNAGNTVTMDMIVAQINALTTEHHVMAIIDVNSRLALTNEPTFEEYGIQINDTSGGALLTALGLATPIKTNPWVGSFSGNTGTLAKARANRRWVELVKYLNEIAPVVDINTIRITTTTYQVDQTSFYGYGTNNFGDISNTVLSLSFNVVYADATLVQSYDQFNNTGLLTGGSAILQAIQKAFMFTITENDDIVNDPAIGSVINSLVVGPIDSTPSNIVPAVTIYG